jgi:hypothetical protein
VFAKAFDVKFDDLNINVKLLFNDCGNYAHQFVQLVEQIRALIGNESIKTGLFYWRKKFIIMLYQN